MTTFREFIGDLIREYFAVPRSTPEVQAAAANWQPYRLPSHLERQPGYMPGQYARRYHTQLVSAIQQATTPNFTRIATTPLAARDIQYENTPHLTTVTMDEDDDMTEIRPAIKRKPTTATQEIPAITGEILLLEMIRNKPTHEQTTGENERINEDAFLL